MDGSPRGRRWGRRTNEAVGRWSTRVDDETGRASRNAAQALVMTVRLLRYPTAALLYAPVPFIAVTAVVAALSDGWFRIVGLLIAAAMATVSLLFGWRRRRMLQAVGEPDQLATELGIMVNLSGHVEETRGILEQLAGGGGARVFSRLKGAWRGFTLPGRVIGGIDELPLARHFAPPRIGITVSLTIAALWLVPISFVVALFTLVGALAGSLG